MVELNSCKNIFFIGIGGIGMSALAIILKERGFNITGSDRAESSTTKQLVKAGIQVTIGHNAWTSDGIAVPTALPISVPNYPFIVFWVTIAGNLGLIALLLRKLQKDKEKPIG